MSLVRSFGEAFRRYIFDALQSSRVLYFLGDLICWRQVLSDPAPPSAGRRDPNRSWCVRVLDSNNTNYIVRACKETLITVFSIRWRAKERVVSGPNRSNDVYNIV